MIAFITTVLCIWGVHSLFLPNMIFGKIGEKAQRYFITKPMFRCPVCMSPWYGLIGFWYSGYEGYWLPVFLLALTGANYLLSEIKAYFE